MSRRVVALLLSAMSAFAQNCLKYGAPTTITGTLLLTDEAGYNQFIFLRPVRPLCTMADPKDVANPAERGRYYRVTEIQAGVYDDEPDADVLRGRLDKLVGQRVTIKGSVFPATTGYHRTSVRLSVQRVAPVDPAGERALRTVKAEIQARDISAYDVTVKAGPRLEIEAREKESGAILVPSEQYIVRWMTGGEVLYVNCRKGYALTPLSIEPSDGAFCDPDTSCGFSAFAEKPVVLRLRCVRQP